jgi:hypothetical protein
VTTSKSGVKSKIDAKDDGPWLAKLATTSLYFVWLFNFWFLVFFFLQASSSSDVSEGKKKHVYTKEHIDRHTSKNTYNIMQSTKISSGLFGWRESMTRDAC